MTRALKIENFRLIVLFFFGCNLVKSNNEVNCGIKIVSSSQQMPDDKRIKFSIIVSDQCLTIQSNVFRERFCESSHAWFHWYFLALMPSFDEFNCSYLTFNQRRTVWETNIFGNCTYQIIRQKVEH